MKVYLDKEGVEIQFVSFMAPSVEVSDNPDFNEDEPESETNLRKLSVEIPYVETRPFIELPDGTDLTNKIVDGGALRDMITEEVEAIIIVKSVAEFKRQRPDLVAAITVNVGGLVFDGDEISQTRMTRAAMVMDDVETMTWVLADNTTTTVTKSQLMQALKLSGQAQSALWVYS